MRRKPPVCPFTSPSPPRGHTTRGKKGHFHLLDRYIRRIDSLVPEEMEDLVRPLSYRPNQQRTVQTLKLTLEEVDVQTAPNVTEDEVRKFFSPLNPSGIVLGWYSPRGEPEIYVQFDTNADCQEGRQRDSELLGGVRALVRYSEDRKFDRVREDLERGWTPFLESEEEFSDSEAEEEGLEGFEGSMEEKRQLADAGWPAAEE